MQVTLDWNLLNQLASFALSLFAIALSLYAMRVAKADAERSEKIQDAIQTQLVQFADRIGGLVTVTQSLERNSVIVFEKVIAGLLSREAPRDLEVAAVAPRDSASQDRRLPARIVPPTAHAKPSDRDSVFEQASNKAIALKYVDIVRKSPGELLYSDVVSSEYEEYVKILDHLIANGVLVVREDRLYVAD